MQKTKSISVLMVLLSLTGCWWHKDKTEEKVMTQYEKTHTEASLSDRILLVEKTIQNTPKDGLNAIKELFVDLETTKKIKKNDPQNLSQKSDETWMYSSNTDLTLIISDLLNTPIYSFPGKSFPQEDFAKAQLFIKMVQNAKK